MEKYLFWVQGPFDQNILNFNISQLESTNIDYKLVVCTNTNDVNLERSDKLDVIIINDPGQDCNKFVCVNYSRQYSTTYPLLDYENIHEYSQVIKFRSDIKIENVSNFIKLLKRNNDKQKIIVSCYSTMHVMNAFNYHNHISDWIYICSPDKLIRLISKTNRSVNVLSIDSEKRYIEHWVGKETCEQAMINPLFFEYNNFYKIIHPINIVKHGIVLRKYYHLFIPKTFKDVRTIVFARLSTYTELDYFVINFAPFLIKTISKIKIFLINLILIRK
jgi:hypothetical protein